MYGGDAEADNIFLSVSSNGSLWVKPWRSGLKSTGAPGLSVSSNGSLWVKLDKVPGMGIEQFAFSILERIVVGETPRTG